MKKYQSIIRLVILFVFFYLILTSKAHAYLDLGTGSYILQIAIAVILGFFVTTKLYWTKIKNFFLRRKNHKEK